MDLSIIIVNYKTADLLCDAVRSIIEHTRGVSYEVIVVDNNSEDHSKELLSEILPCLKYVALDQNIGFGRANNEGIGVSSARNVIFLNPDTLLINDALTILSNYLDANPKVGVVGANLFDADLKPTHSHNLAIPSIGEEIDQACMGVFSKIRYGKNKTHNYSNKPLEVAFICGADMMTRREILDAIGGFDPDFFMYFEETELTYRIKKAGYSVLNIPKAKIIHLEGKSFSNSRPRELRSLTSRKIFFNKVYSKRYANFAHLNYLVLNKIAHLISIIIGAKGYRAKLHQRLSVLKEINNRNKI